MMLNVLLKWRFKGIYRDSLKNDTEDFSQNTVTTKKWKGKTKAMDVDVNEATILQDKKSRVLY